MGSERRAVRNRGVAALVLNSALAAAMTFGVFASAAGPSAADRETARTLMKEGDRFMREDDATQALRSYQAAHNVMNVPSTGMAVVRALTRLGRLVEARDVALHVIRTPLLTNEPAVFTQAREEAASAARDLESRIAGLIVNVEAARVVIDGTALADTSIGLVRKVDPGHHVIVVSAPGCKDATLEVTLAEGETRELRVELEQLSQTSPAAPASSPSRPVVIAPVPRPQQQAAPIEQEPSQVPRVLLIGGASLAFVGIAVGSITGYMAMNRTSELKDSCPAAGCPPGLQDDFDSAHRLATVSNVAFGAGVVGIAVGTCGYLLSGSRPRTGSARATGPSAWPVAGFGSVGIQGRF